MKSNRKKDSPEAREIKRQIGRLMRGKMKPSGKDYKRDKNKTDESTNNEMK